MISIATSRVSLMLQQYLLSTILRQVRVEFCSCVFMVATAPIVHGIETKKKEALIDYPLRVVTVLTVYGMRRRVQYSSFSIYKKTSESFDSLVFFLCLSFFEFVYIVFYPILMLWPMSDNN